MSLMKLKDRKKTDEEIKTESGNGLGLEGVHTSEM